MPSSRYSKYSITRLGNLIPKIKIGSRQRNIIKNRLHKYKNPKSFNLDLYDELSASKVLVKICSGYINDKIKDNCKLKGELKVICGMTKKHLLEAGYEI